MLTQPSWGPVSTDLFELEFGPLITLPSWLGRLPGTLKQMANQPTQKLSHTFVRPQELFVSTPLVSYQTYSRCGYQQLSHMCQMVLPS